MLLVEQPREQRGRERVAGARPGLGIVVGERRALVEPLPQDRQPDLAGRHVLHEVQDVVVAEEVGGLERRGLEPAQERVAVLEADRQQVAGAPHGPRRGLASTPARPRPRACGSAAGTRGPAGCPRRRAPTPAGRCGPSSSGRPTCRSRPRRCSRSAPATAFAIAASTPAGEPTGICASMPPCHSANRPAGVGRVDGPPHAVLVGAHVGVRHRDRVDVRVGEARIAVEGVRHRVDVVPATGVEADEVAARARPGSPAAGTPPRAARRGRRRGSSRPAARGAPRARRGSAPRPPPRPRPGSWAGTGRPTGPRRGASRRSRRRTATRSTIEAENPSPSAPPDVAVVEVEAARAVDPRRERELGPPVVDDPAARGTPRPSAFISPATDSATARNRGSIANASRRLRWLSRLIVSTWPSASSPSNIQPSAPDSSA